MKVSHCFAINGNSTDPYVTGMNNVVDLYRSTLKDIVLDGPTYLSDVLKNFQASV
jgi:hypothetical protein